MYEEIGGGERKKFHNRSCMREGENEKWVKGNELNAQEVCENGKWRFTNNISPPLTCSAVHDTAVRSGHLGVEADAVPH